MLVKNIYICIYLKFILYIYILFVVYTYGRTMCIDNIVLKYWCPVLLFFIFLFLYIYVFILNVFYIYLYIFCRSYLW